MRGIPPGHNGAMGQFSVDQDSPLTAWGQVERDLRRRIDVAEFGPGAKLPSEAELAREYGVSRETVRRALESLAADGLLRTRRGSGTFVADSGERARYDIDLLRPWREQLLADGHVARSRLVEVAEVGDAPPEPARLIGHDAPKRLLRGLAVHEADGIALALTESWLPVDSDGAVPRRARTALASASGVVRIGYADVEQARLLDCVRGAPLLEVVTCSRLRETGEAIEVARTSWLAVRVSLTYGRTLVVGQIDATELLANAITGDRA
jgi:DNA-binding GntR family transcriptional regulator